MLKNSAYESRIDEVRRVLLAYASGNYSAQGNLSSIDNPVDSILNGVNMLGEELKASSAETDSFKGIFNAISDYLILIDEEGTILEINKSAREFFNYKKSSGITLEQAGMGNLYKWIKKNTVGNTKEILLSDNNNNDVRLRLNYVSIKDKQNGFIGYLICLNNVPLQEKTETSILRAITAHQDKEQKRMADDLHDSLGQDLSAIKLFMNSLSKYMQDAPEKYREIFNYCTDTVDSAILNLKEVCFNLMPLSMEAMGIIEAIGEIIARLEKQNLVHFHYSHNPEFPSMDKEREMVIFRITQEFINNTIKHANAGNIYIHLDFTDEFALLSIRDDGSGFNIEDINTLSGRGIKSFKTRADAFGGKVHLTSIKNKGTEIVVELPFGS